MKKRDFNIDLIKFFAVVFVVFVHFLLNSGFYMEPIISKKMVLLDIFRNILICCVPLFLMITGYLNCDKKCEKNYFKKIFKVLFLYLIISTESYFFKLFYLKEITFSLTGFIIGFFNYTNVSYAWYVEMYIGLFFLIPFLNTIIENLSKRNFLILLYVLIALCILPTALNIFDLSSLSGFVNTNVNSNFSIISNDYWYALWPFLYYFLGAYIKKFKPNISLKKNIILLLLSFSFISFFNLVRNLGFIFSDYLYTQYFGFEAFIVSYLLFVLFVNLKIKDNNSFIKKIISGVSKNSLGIYLSSYIFDSILYLWLTNKYPIINDRLLFFPFIPLIVLVLSYVFSIINNYIMDFIVRIYYFVKHLICKIVNFFYLKIISISNKEIFVYIIFFIVCIFYFILGIYKSKYGFGSADEAFYLTVPFRMAKGDLLLLKEWHLSQLAWFVIYPIMKLYLLFFDTTGIILFFRVLFLIFKIVMCLFIFKKLKNYNFFGAIISSILFLLYTPYNLLQFSYNSMGMIFVLLFALFFNSSKKIGNLFSGICYALSVMCCPYCVLICLPIFGKLVYKFIKRDKISTKKYFTFFVGILIIFTLFLIYMLSGASIKDIIEVLPNLFLDPEHTSSSWLNVLSLFFNTFFDYFKYTSYPFIIILILILIDYLLNKKVLYKNLYIAIYSVFVIFQLLLFNTFIYGNYNFIMLPVSCLVILITIIMILEKNKMINDFKFVVLISLLYGIFLIFSSNQIFYCFSTAVSLMTILSPIIIILYFKENVKIYKKGMTIILAMLLMVQISSQLNSNFNHVFPMFKVEQMTNKMEYGPYKGLIVSKEDYDSFKSSSIDLDFIKELDNGNFLCYNCLPYYYLYVNKDISAHSCWGGDIDYQLLIEEKYQNINLDKIPKYVYVKKNDYMIVSPKYENYSKLELQNGYLLVREER